MAATSLFATASLPDMVKMTHIYDRQHFWEALRHFLLIIFPSCVGIKAGCMNLRPVYNMKSSQLMTNHGLPKNRI